MTISSTSTQLPELTQESYERAIEPVLIVARAPQKWCVKKPQYWVLTHHSRGGGGRPAAMGPGEERLDDHGVRAGGEVRLRGGPSVGRGRRRDGLFPARGASELEPREAALIAARDRDEVVGHARVPGADAGARRVAGRGGGQAQRAEPEAGGWGRGGEGGGSEAARGVGGAERRGAEEERRRRHFFSGLVLRWRERASEVGGFCGDGDETTAAGWTWGDWGGVRQDDVEH